MRRYVSGKKFYFSYILFFAIAAVIIGIVFFMSQIDRHVEELVSYTSKNTIGQIIEEATEQTLQQTDNISVEILKDGDGNITSITPNPSEINSLENTLRKNINSLLDELENDNVKIPVGSLTGINLLSGKGGEICVDIHQIAASEIKLSTEIKSAGINQTLYTVSAEVSTEITAILPTGKHEIKTDSSYIILQKVIVGKVPENNLSLK